MAGPAKASGKQFVRAARVQVKTTGGGVKHLMYGDTVTDDVAQESLDLLKELGFLSQENPLDADANVDN